MNSPNVGLFRERFTYHVSEGARGAEVYRRLACDNALPIFFTTEEVASICGLKVDSMRIRRARKLGPTAVTMGERLVQYPRDLFCEWMAEAFARESTR